MTSRIAGGAAPTRPSSAALQAPHHEQSFRADAQKACQLVARLQVGKGLLFDPAIPTDQRERAEMTWRRLIANLHVTLRSAYAHWSLLKTTKSYEEAIALWKEVMPPQEPMDVIGIGELLCYWEGRLDPPEWLTSEEMQRIVKVSWPPSFTLDVFDHGIGEFYSPPPF